MLRTLLVDPDALARKDLRAQLASFPVEIVGEASGSGEAAQLAAAISYHLIFMEVGPQALWGLQLARELAARPAGPQVVFTAADPAYAAEAFQIGATDFLLKPYTYDRLRQVFAQIQARTGRARGGRKKPEQAGEPPPALRRLPVEADGRVLLIDPAEIIYAYALDEQVFLKLAAAKVRCQYTVRELEERLGPSGFLRTHRRYLVNVAKVREVIPYFKGALGLVVEDAERSEVPVSRAMAPAVRPRLGL